MSIALNETDRAAFEQIRYWLNHKCGMYYPDKKQELLLDRMLHVCKRYYFENIATLAAHLNNEEATEIQLAVISAASTNHTYFFRECAVLDYYRDVILPTFKDNHDNRIWSAAASTGDEAYTAAVITAEQRGLAWTKQNFTILGTDISAPVIADAEQGIYQQSHLEHVPAPILKRYFEKTDFDQYQIHQDIRSLCTFRRMNLKIHPYPFKGQFSVVFCRNVLYYFDEKTQQDIVESIYDVTQQGGWLLSSVTDSLRHLKTRWIQIDSGIYRKK
jgi:chemotaxis protein methyltransferase CheR